MVSPGRDEALDHVVGVMFENRSFDAPLTELGQTPFKGVLTLGMLMVATCQRCDEMPCSAATGPAP